MRAGSIWLGCVSATLAVMCALTDPSYADAAEKAKKTMAVLFDRNIPPEMQAGPAQSQNEISGYMENQLLTLLNKKYRAELIAGEADYDSGGYDHLLKVKVVKYHRGSSAARALVGFGAGAAYLDIHYELLDRNGQSLVSKDDGASTSMHWSRIPNKLNKNILKDVSSAVDP